MTADEARRLAHAWVEAWNARDLDRILAHYAEDVEFRSPFVVALTGDPSGCLRGRARLRDYFARALGRFPLLHFDLHEIYVGVDSLVVRYTSVNGLPAAETMEIGADGRVCAVRAHYGGAPMAAAAPDRG